MAKQQLDQLDPDSPRIVVFVCDGHEWPESSETSLQRAQVVDQLKAEGVVIVSIAIGTGANQALMREIASSDAFFHYSSHDDLVRTFGSKLCDAVDSIVAP